MTTKRTSPNTENAQVKSLQARLQEAEDTLDAIRNGAIDALVVKDNNKQQVFTLKSADYTYRVLIESMNQGAVTITQDGIILYSNKQFSNMTAKPLEQIIGSSIESLAVPEDRPLMKSIIDQTAEGAELTVRLNSPEYIVVMMSATKLPDIEGEPYMGLVVTDMTQIKRTEAAKDEFISLASHQLRTPATGVKQYLGMLLEGYAGEITEPQRIFARTAYDSNERQLGIINSILKTAQIDFGRYALKKSFQGVQDLVSAILADFEPMFTMRKQNVESNIEKDVRIHVEPVEMSLALSNLIENASKYSPVGTIIRISAYTKDDATYLSVTDQGVGIAASDRERIFTKFTRIDNALSDTVSGSGLGLYWVKKIVELHGGTLELESEEGAGSTFTIRLPA